MSQYQSLLTPELIEIITKQLNTENTGIAGIQNQENGGGYDNGDAPKSIKFKFTLCDVDINNYNAAVEESGNQSPRKE